jgi:hypothetical protein
MAATRPASTAARNYPDPERLTDAVDTALLALR